MKSCRSSNPLPKALLVITLVGVVGISKETMASSCAVPGSHSSIQTAVDDPSCSDIQLASQPYDEILEINRSLQLAGPVSGNSEIRGRVVIGQAGTSVTLSNLGVHGACTGGVVRVTGGAQLAATMLRVTWNGSVLCAAELIFRDGFESP